MHRRVMMFLLVAALSPVVTAAQLAPAAGDRVRITEIDGSVHTGQIRTVSPTDIQILDDELDGLLVVPADGLSGIERSLGEHGSFGKRFFATLGIGAGVGFLLVGPFLPVCKSLGPCSPGSRGTAMVQGMVLSTLAAIPIGLVIGATKKTERWAPAGMPADRDATFSLVVGAERGIGARITLPLGGGS